ncbi:AAA family ATPase, partial [Klebsiella pneumoniae]|nr:AAA family ATPase [Klebsiella pneumoniae]
MCRRVQMYIKKLGLENFKKVKGLDIEFGNELTTIAGENGTGKSSIMDAFMWVLFGKDSHDRANF